MRRIPLTQGKEALVSDCDYKYLMQWKWWYNKHHGNGGYAIRKIGDRKVYMHKVVASRKGLPPGQVDHKNQNKLDNQRGNLRPATFNPCKPCSKSSTTPKPVTSFLSRCQRKWLMYLTGPKVSNLTGAVLRLSLFMSRANLSNFA